MKKKISLWNKDIVTWKTRQREKYVYSTFRVQNIHRFAHAKWKMNCNEEKSSNANSNGF